MGDLERGKHKILDFGDIRGACARFERILDFVYSIADAPASSITTQIPGWVLLKAVMMLGR